MTLVKQPKHSRVLVKARSDGRGGVRPFGVFNEKQKGVKVYIGDVAYKVTSDGRVNIPKHIMEQGTKGKDGRYRILIEFSTPKGRTGKIKGVYTRIFKPDKHTRNLGTNKKPKKNYKEKKIIVREDEYEFTWSPIR